MALFQGLILFSLSQLKVWIISNSIKSCLYDIRLTYYHLKTNSLHFQDYIYYFMSLLGNCFLFTTLITNFSFLKLTLYLLFVFLILCSYLWIMIFIRKKQVSNNISFPAFIIFCDYESNKEKNYYYKEILCKGYRILLCIDYFFTEIFLNSWFLSLKLSEFRNLLVPLKLG